MLTRAAVIVALLSLVIARQVGAQSPEEAALLRITPQQFESHAAALELTVAQRAAAEAMFVEYQREFEDAWKAETAMVEWLWSNTAATDWWGGESEEAFSDTVSREAMAIELQWQRGVRELEARYFDGLRRTAIGRDEQVESLRRARVRQRLLLQERLREPAGAATDLTVLVDQFDNGLASRPDVSAVLAEYELALDRLLHEHDEWVITRRVRVHETRENAKNAEQTGGDVAAARAAQADIYVGWWRSSNAIWQLEIDTAARIAALLPAEQHAAFDDATCVALRRYLRPDTGPMPEEAFDAALRRTDLVADQRTRLEALREQWRARRAAALSELTRAYLQTCDPAQVRAAYLLILSGKGEEAMQQIRARDQTWQEARQPWLVECERIVAAIDSILSDRQGEPAR